MIVNYHQRKFYSEKSSFFRYLTEAIAMIKESMVFPQGVLRVLFAALWVGTAAIQAQGFTPYKIPLYIFNLKPDGPAEYKVGIRLRIDAVDDGSETLWRMYEFDTGGTGFFAFPYQASSNATGDYQLHYASGNFLGGNLANTRITFENMAGEEGNAVTTNIALITEASNSKHPDDALNHWTERLPDHPPLEKYFYGDFGMGLAGTKATVDPGGNPTLYAVIPQLSGPENTGFIIHLGHRPHEDAPVGEYGEVGRGWIQVGLDPDQQNAESWESVVKMVTPTGDTFPHSGQPVYDEILSNGTLELTGVGPLAAGIVYDTGAPNTEIHPVGTTSPEVAEEIQNALNGDDTRLTLMGDPEITGHDSTILDYIVGTGSGKNKAGISDQDVIGSPGLYVNTGITAFFDKEVAFNLEDGFVGFKQVPEPSTWGLFGLSALGFFWVLRRRKN